MKKLLLLVLVLSLSSITFASVITINFEQYSGYTQITNQYQAGDGVVFANALQLVAPFYDDTDYPPHSGSGVILNDPWDPIQVTFTDSTVGVRTASFWYTDPDGIVVTGYGVGGNVLATVMRRGVRNERSGERSRTTVGRHSLTLRSATWAATPTT